MKNGMLFKGDGVRVRVDHKSIIFTSVSKSDYGLYSVTAHNEAGRGQAYIYLKGIFFHCPRIHRYCSVPYTTFVSGCIYISPCIILHLMLYTTLGKQIVHNLTSLSYFYVHLHSLTHMFTDKCVIVCKDVVTL